MCCRYYYDNMSINEMMEELGVSRPDGVSFPGGVITPGSDSIMLTGMQSGLKASVANWGFPGKERNLVINARAETAAERPMFRNAMETRRCLLPAECFYEWDRDKNKVTFSGMDTQIIYLAGLWSLYDNIIRFVVLTTAANASMIPVHDRMPLMVDPGNIDSWLFDTSFALKFLRAEMPLLKAQRDYEQMSFI